MNPKISMIIFLSSVGLLLGGIFLVTKSQYPSASISDLDNFAKCLTDRGVVMYGAAWCPHCQKQKKAFASSFQYVKYVECPNNPELCTEKEVTGYPTWIFADGSRLEGEVSLEKLSQQSSCPLSTN